ncbi:ABC transporter permease [Candidatus Berkiella aquae]|uniref:Transport permease protein n=1 Tax=Candidatus Berkiella aquae TaxID=295108 RepID=A0A0Q9YNW6_9GAMM|nr:ABC transporter permease [Candidatus Berkiella aquae]MCS5709906.1 ABC transporter permease [Candidatus Berkiella aquae]
MNYRGVLSIYQFEMARTFRTIGQSIAAPVLLTVLYFIVFGSALGNQIANIDGIAYGAYIVPGLMMLTVLSESVSNAAFGIYFPRFTGTIYEVLSAPISFVEIILGYVGAAASKSIMVGLIILLTSSFFVDINIVHPFYMLGFLILTAISFSLLGFIIGVWANGFQQLQNIPLLIIMPLSFLGGSFYSIKMLPPFWQKVSLINPVVYLISGFRWSFYGSADLNIEISLIMISLFLIACLAILYWIFKTGYRLKS